jgi:hypothetical protein
MAMLVTLRSFIYLVFLTLTTLVIAPALYLLKWVLPFPMLAKLGKLWGRLNLEAVGVICGLKYRVHGWEKLPRENCIVLSKHQSDLGDHRPARPASGHQHLGHQAGITLDSFFWMGHGGPGPHRP